MKKSIFSLVAGAMLIAQPISAASIADLQAQVNLLMQILQQLIAQVALLPTTPTVTPAPEPVYCTAEYRPVCGQYDALRVTYTNKCELDKANAIYLYEGVCQSTPPVVTNVPPVIKSISGPTQLQVNEVGTWRVSAYDRDNDVLTYSISWGDEPVYWFNSLTSATPRVTTQNTTFQHSYRSAGRYTITITVSDSFGRTTTSSITVFVSPSVVSNTCVVDDIVFTEGQSTNCISNSDGSRSCIADASYVCRGGEWKIEGGYPAI